MSLTGLVWSELADLVIKHGVAPTLVEKESKGNDFVYELTLQGRPLGRIAMRQTLLPEFPYCVVLSATKAGSPPTGRVFDFNPWSYRPDDVTTGMRELFGYLMESQK